MGLLLKNIRFENFRNYSKYSLSDIGPLTVFHGPNAVGKTNIIEGIQLVTSLSSFKSSKVNQLISWDSSYARVDIQSADDIRQLDISLLLHDGKKKYSLNNKEKSTKELRGILPSVVFSPDNLQLIKGGHKDKRNAIDSIGTQLTKNYAVIKKDYEKILRHKNALLKEDKYRQVIDSVDELFITVGTQLFCYRDALLRKMTPYIQDRYEYLVHQKESIALSYTPSWIDEENECLSSVSYTKEEAHKQMSLEVKKKREEEILRKHALVGPHLDKIDFFIDGKNAAFYGSQGQQRSLVLSFKLAELEIIKEQLSQRPILLLDDVMSELDSSRREALIEIIQSDTQTFITTTHLDYFNSSILNNAQIIELLPSTHLERSYQ